MSDEYVLVHLVGYEEPTEVDYDSDEDRIINHDELEKFDEVRSLHRESAEEAGLDIITDDDPMWRDEFEDIEDGEGMRL